MFDFIKSGRATLKPNYMLIPVTKADSMDQFNEVYLYFKSLEDKGIYSYGIERTPSGGICIDRRKRFMLNKYEVKTDKNLGCELLVLGTYPGTYEPAFFRLQFGAQKSEQVMSGTQAFKIFKRELKKDGIDIEDYYKEGGKEEKEKIEKPIIEVSHPLIQNLTIENCHHIDIRSSYPSGMAECIPDWKKTIERLYFARKEHPVYKQVLDMACGYFQAPRGMCHMKLAYVSRFAIARNNQKVMAMSKWLMDHGRTVLMYNVDGIWFKGERTYFEGKNLGDWKEDHHDCTLRIKSKGAYEYIEDGKYYPVVRGSTKLDKFVPRESWQWGDIYQDDAKPVEIYFTRENGLQLSNEEFLEWRKNG